VPSADSLRQDLGVLLSELVSTLDRVAATRARSVKVAALAELLARVGHDELEPAVGLVSGVPRQGKVGVGSASLWGRQAEGEEPEPVEAVEPEAAVADASRAAEDELSAAAADAPSADRPSTLTIGDLDAAISELQALAGPGSAAARRRLLADLFRRATPPEASYIRRLLLGDLRQGALEGIVTEAVARAAGVPAAVVRRAAMLAGDLSRVAAVAMAEGESGLAGIGLEVLRPLQPMLASTANDVVEAIGGLGLSSVEWKLDGARVQAHRKGETVRLFTRNLNDVTSRLPGVAAAVLALPGHQFVLDGEVLGVSDDERPDLFQDTMSRFGRHDGAGASLNVWWFDCLHLDGDDLIDRPLVERAEILDRLAGPSRVPATLTDDPGAAAAFLEQALNAGHEGVMVKAASSLYEAGRRGQAWRKVKPVRTLDLVVLAAEWGHGRRQGWLSNLHLGARDPAGGFVMVGKTFKGLTDQLLGWQTERLQELEVARRGIVVEVRPELVVEIALDGVQGSTRYAGGVALRFARVRRYRPDKTAAQADDIDAVRAMLPGVR
jgi:DNA ligase-1